MAWAKLADDFHSHPKVLAVGNVGAGLFARSVAYAAHYLTDGFLPAASAAMLAGPDQPIIPALVAAGLWEPCDGGYRIHQYLERNPTRAAVLERRRVRAAAGQVGGKASGSARSKQTRSKPASKHEASSFADASTMFEANANPVPVPVPSRDLPLSLQASGLDLGSGARARARSNLEADDAGRARGRVPPQEDQKRGMLPALMR